MPIPTPRSIGASPPPTPQPPELAVAGCTHAPAELHESPATQSSSLLHSSPQSPLVGSQSTGEHCVTAPPELVEVERLAEQVAAAGAHFPD
jgi:hypothetical protein